MNDAHHFELNT